MKNINIFGTDVNFNHDGSRHYKTTIGVFFTFFFLGFTPVLLFLLGKDFYMRTNPKYRYTEQRNVYENVDLNNFVFDFMFRIEDVDGNLFADYAKFIDVKARYSLFSKIDGVFQDSGSRSISIHLCNETNIQSEKFVQGFNISNYFCFDKSTIKLGGYWDSTFVNYVNIQVSRCDSKNDQNCYNSTAQNEFFKNNYIYISLYTQDAVVDIDKYESSIDFSPKNLFFSIDKSLQKSYSLFFKQTKLVTDFGWMLTNIIKNEGLGFDFLSVDINKSENGAISNIYLYMGKRKEDYVREFVKIQNVIAETGGLLNFFLILFGSLTNQYAYNHIKLKVVKGINQNKNSDAFNQKILESNGNNKLNKINHSNLGILKNENVIILKDREINVKPHKEKLDTLQSIEVKMEQLPRLDLDRNYKNYNSSRVDSKKHNISESISESSKRFFLEKSNEFELQIDSKNKIPTKKKSKLFELVSVFNIIGW